MPRPNFNIFKTLLSSNVHKMSTKRPQNVHKTSTKKPRSGHHSAKERLSAINYSSGKLMIEPGVYFHWRCDENADN